MLGVVLLALAYAATGALPAFEAPYAWEVWVTGLVGLVLIGTAATRFCVIYRVIGADTCSD